jgi:oligopeptide/dipeptide ABC transporter ATP-binding protein
LDLLRSLQAEHGMAILLITHDLGIVAETAERVAIMYAGQIIEEASTPELFANPKHPYTIGLFASLPKITETRERLQPIAGQVPAATNFPAGCRFHPRCPHCMEVCKRIIPAFKLGPPDHWTACWLYEPEESRHAQS